MTNEVGKGQLRDFVKKLIQFRKEHAYALAPSSYGGGAPFAWKNAGNSDLTDWGVRHFAIHYYDASVGPEIEILINMEGRDVQYQLPDGEPWKKVVDSQAWFDDTTYIESAGEPRRSHNIELDNPDSVADGTYTVTARSIVVLTR